MRPGFGIGQQRSTESKEIDWRSAQTAVELVSGKWTIRVIAVLFQEPRRHGSVRRAVGSGVSDKVLTETLRRMEHDGLLTRRVVAGNPPAVFYSLSELGRSLADPLGAMAEWHESVPSLRETGSSPEQ
jgi:DNA-binding HxlR family transcriptional regulator